VVALTGSVAFLLLKITSTGSRENCFAGPSLCHRPRQLKI